MAGNPWMKWYPSDWRADPLVRACSPIARYVWMEMIGLMHEAEPYGHLVLAGKPLDYSTLARLIGMEVGEVKRAVKELESRNVFSRSEDGAIFSRRMIRDENRRKTLAKNGQRGGNPGLKKQGVSPRLDNQEDIQTPNQKDKPQKPEARSQKLESNNNGSPFTPRASPDVRRELPISEFEQQCRLLADTINLTRPVAAPDRQALRQWLAEGFDFKFHVIEGAKSVVARAEARGSAIHSFKYLDAGIREYRAEWLAERERLRVGARS